MDTSSLSFGTRLSVMIGDTYLNKVMPDSGVRASLATEIEGLENEKIKNEAKFTPLSTDPEAIEAKKIKEQAKFETLKNECLDVVRSTSDRDVFMMTVSSFISETASVLPTPRKRESETIFPEFAAWLGEGIRRLLSGVYEASPDESAVNCMIRNFSDSGMSVFLNRYSTVMNERLRTDPEAYTSATATVEVLEADFAAQPALLGHFLADAINNKIAGITVGIHYIDNPPQKISEYSSAEFGPDDLSLIQDIPFIRDTFRLIGALASSGNAQGIDLVHRFWTDIGGSLVIPLLVWVDVTNQVNERYLKHTDNR